jgi:hypothetical protein
VAQAPKLNVNPLARRVWSEKNACDNQEPEQKPNNCAAELSQLLNGCCFVTFANKPANISIISQHTINFSVPNYSPSRVQHIVKLYGRWLLK